MSRTILLIGVSGSGKTTVANYVSTLGGMDLHDFSATFFDQVGEDDAAYLVRHGRAEYEATATRVALGILDRSGVLTLSPDVIRSAAVRQKIETLKENGAEVVELYADVSTLMRRTGLNAPRSVALGPTRQIFAKMVSEYRSEYSGLAQLVIDTSLSKPAHIGERILAFQA